MSLARRSVLAALWSSADIASREGLSFAFSMLLARMLEPEAFGTIGLMQLFLSLANCFVDGGCAAALVQRQHTTKLEESTIFWFNMGMGLLMSTALWALAPAIARFYRQPILADLAPALGLNVLINAAGSVHSALLLKRMEFRAQARIGVTAITISGGVAAVLAAQGYGVWALVGQALSFSAVTTLLLWHASGWRPSLAFNLRSAGGLFGFGSYVFAANLLRTLHDNLSRLLIGKLHGVRDLGYFERADGTKQVPMEALAHVLSSVAFPAFSAAADDKPRLLRGVRLAVRVVMLVNLPIMMGLAAAADPLVAVLFGERWLPAVPIFRILCFEAALWPLRVVNVCAMLAGGRSDSYLRLESLTMAFGIALLALGSLSGPEGVAAAQVAICIVSVILSARHTWKTLNYGLLAQLRDIAPVAAVAATAAIAAAAVGVAVADHSPLDLVVRFAVVGMAFLLIGYLTRLTALGEVRRLLARGPAAGD